MRAPSDVDPRLALDRCVAIQRASSAIVRRTPLLTSASFSADCGGTVALKAECLQRTGSFKLRGALNKLRALGSAGAAGVVAGSAGNHAQSLAYAARQSGVPCEVFMPVDAAVSKLDAVRAFGATVHQQGRSVDDCVALARERAADSGAAFVHPFDDWDVIAGQAGLGVELAQDGADVRKVVVPVGGGGLAAGVAAVVRQLLPEAEVIGVQAAACAPAVRARHPREAATPAGRTIADGIAVKRPGDVTLPLLEALLDDVVAVPEEAIATAVVRLLERSKLLVEGAGATALGALLSGVVRPAGQGTTVAVLSGGNVDLGLVAALAAHHETRAGRRARVFTRVDDRPGGLAGLLATVAAENANVIAVEHLRDGIARGVHETGIELVVETRGRRHQDQLLGALAASGYAIDTVDLEVDATNGSDRT